MIPIINSDKKTSTEDFNILDISNDAKYELVQLAALFSGKVKTQEIGIDSRVPKLTCREISGLIRKSGILSRICSIYPESVYSNDYKFNIPDYNNQGLKEYLDAIPVYTEFSSNIKCRGIYSAFRLADILARQYGTAYIVFGFKDNENLDAPLNFGQIEGIEFLYVYEQDRFSYGVDDYAYTSQGIRVHHSRVLEVPGIEILSYESYLYNGYHHDSVITSLLESFSIFSASLKNTSSLLESTSMLTLGIKGLGLKMQQDKDSGTTTNQSAIQARANYLSQHKSISEMWIYDLDKEVLGTLERNLANLTDVLAEMKGFLAANVDIPRWKLLSEFGSTSGLSNNIESARMLNFEWLCQVHKYAKSKWSFYIDFILYNLVRSPSFSIPETYNNKQIIFPFGLKMSDTENIEFGLKLTEYYQKLLDLGVRTEDDLKEIFKDNDFSFVLELL
jgi:hypothetical protein